MSAINPVSHQHKEEISKHVTEKKKISGTKAKQYASNIQGNSGYAPKTKSDYICHLKYTNKLPAIPCEPKFLKIDTYSEILNDVENSTVFKTIKYPLYPPSLPLPFIGFDKYSNDIKPTNKTIHDSDIALLTETEATFKEKSSIPERPTSTFTGQFLREVEYNDGMIFSEKNIDPHSLPQQVFDSIRKPVNPLEQKTELTEHDYNVLTDKRIEIINKEFEPFVVPENCVHKNLKPKCVYDVFPDTLLFSNDYIIGKFEDKQTSIFDNNNYSSIIIRPYEKVIQPRIPTQSSVTYHLGEILQVDSSNDKHYKWKNTYEVNIADRINKYGITENYLLQYNKDQIDTVEIQSSNTNADNEEQQVIPKYTLTYTPIESEKIIYLKKTNDGDLARTDIIIERTAQSSLTNEVAEKLTNPYA